LFEKDTTVPLRRLQMWLLIVVRTDQFRLDLGMAHQITTDPVHQRACPHDLSESHAVRATQRPSLRPQPDPGLYWSRAQESTESDRPEPGVPQNGRQGSRGRAPHCEVRGAPSWAVGLVWVPRLHQPGPSSPPPKSGRWALCVSSARQPPLVGAKPLAG